jgi:uncharacterized protein
MMQSATSVAPLVAAAGFVDPERGVADGSAALDGARAILIERFGENADLIGELRERMWGRGRLVSRLCDGKQEAGAKFADYFEFDEPFSRLPSHRIPAMFRGERKVLGLTMDPGRRRETAPETCSQKMKRSRRSGSASPVQGGHDRWLADTVKMAWRSRIQAHLARTCACGCGSGLRTTRWPCSPRT